MFGVNDAFADDPTYGWWNGAMKIGSVTTDFTAWSTSGETPTDLGTLTDMTITNIDVMIWSKKSRTGANMYFRIWDGGASQVGSDQNLWLGNITYQSGSDYSASWSGTENLASLVGLTLEAGHVYYIDMWAKTYGGDPNVDEWYNGTGSNFHAKMTYLPNKATIGATGWTTFSRSYPLDLSNMTASTGSVTAFYASSANASYVTMTSTTATIAANEGIMLKGTAGAEITIPVAASAGSAIPGNMLVGCPTGETVNYNSNSCYNYVLVNNGGAPEFQLIVEGTYGSVDIPAGKAYLALGSDPSGAPALRIIEQEDNATGIQNIEANEKAVKFIENGKFLIQKNGIVYDMTGRVIR